MKTGEIGFDGYVHKQTFFHEITQIALWWKIISVWKEKCALFHEPLSMLFWKPIQKQIELREHLLKVCMFSKLHLTLDLCSYLLPGFLEHV